ncbi:MAG: A/G-specific adenine glycosylase [Calditrichia bacterium]
MDEALIDKPILAEMRRALLDWFKLDARIMPWRGEKNLYRIWVSEVMLQQTQVVTVERYYPRFIKRFPDIPSLANSSLDDVLKSWEGLGYYARARNLHKAAGIVMERYSGEIPTTYREFRKLPGVGDYVAAAVLSIGCGQPLAAVDGNVKRVLARLFLLDAPVNQPSSHKTFAAVAGELLSRHHPGQFNEAMMELGALVCRPQNPQCQNCPLAGFCRALRTGAVLAYPKKTPKKQVPTYQIAVGVLVYQNKVLITRRPEEGLLGGLWEFPGGKVEKGETAEQACRRELAEEVGIRVSRLQFLKTVRHAYTHFKIEMSVFWGRVDDENVRLNGATDYRWVEADELTRFAFPAANHKFIPDIKNTIR